MTRQWGQGPGDRDLLLPRAAARRCRRAQAVPLTISNTAGCSVGSLRVAGLISRIHLSRNMGKSDSVGTGEARCAEVSETRLLLLVLCSLLFLPIYFLCERPVVGRMGIWGERGQRDKRGAKEGGKKIKSRLLCALLCVQKLCPSWVGTAQLFLCHGNPRLGLSGPRSGSKLLPPGTIPAPSGTRLSPRLDSPCMQTSLGSLCISSSLANTKDLSLLKHNRCFWE